MSSPKPKADKAYVEAFKTTAKESMSGAALDVVIQAVDKAEKIGPAFAKSLCKIRVPHLPWEGEWDLVLRRYVGTGEYADDGNGEDVRRPLENAPSWWKEQRYIDGARYCKAYAECSTFDDMMREFWFAGKEPEDVESAIHSAHRALNSWCKRNNKHPVRQKPKRRSFLTSGQAKKYIKSKGNPDGFIVDK